MSVMDGRDIFNLSNRDQMDSILNDELEIYT